MTAATTGTGGAPVESRSRTLGIDVEVAGVVDETADARTIRFRLPDGIEQRPGQFVTIRIPSDRTGSVARSYSLSTAPGVDDVPAVTIKRVADGYGSNWLCDNISEGDVLHIIAPSGVFTPHSWDHRLTLFAAGSGITPVMSILRSALELHTCPVTLFYANRDRPSTIFADELDRLVARHPERLRVHHWREDSDGLPTADAVAPLCAASRGEVAGGEVFVCGPAPFMDLVEREALAAGVPHTDLHIERYVSLTGDPFTLSVADEGSAPCALTVHIDGSVAEIGCATTTPLLDAMLSEGIDAPYSCREGDCGSCVARLVSGTVDHGNGIALEPEDIDDGYLLACQATPRSAVVEIEIE